MINFIDYSLVAQMVKRLSTMRETRVRALGWEDPLEKEMAIHSSTVAWKIPWTEKPSTLQSMGLQRLGMTERLHFTFTTLWPTSSLPCASPSEVRRAGFFFSVHASKRVGSPSG